MLFNILKSISGVEISTRCFFKFFLKLSHLLGMALYRTINQQTVIVNFQFEYISVKSLKSFMIRVNKEALITQSD